MKTVVIGFVGATLDRAREDERWDRWRPTVALVQHDDFVVDRLELLYDAKFRDVADQVVEDIALVSPETEVRLHATTWSDPWDFEQVYGGLLDFCQAYPFNPDEEAYLVHLTTGTHVAQICWFLLTESRHIPGRLIQTSPPPKARLGSPGTRTIIDLDLQRYDSIAARFQREAEAGLAFLKGGIATRNAAFNALIEEIEQVAIHSHAPILLTGPTGAGKTQLARRIHALKHQRRQVKGAFVAVNCGTLRGDAAMAALFGHTKGAFTGANVERAGLLKAADGGVLFLDEIGELGLDEQAMLLHAIEEKRFRPLGSDQETSSDFQLISGTNRDLAAAVRVGKFRADLLARINLWTYRLPGLAERREDIAPNLQFECERFEEAHGRKVRFNREAERLFLAFATGPDALWKGNFRDLAASVLRMATLAGQRRIDEAIVTREIERLRAEWADAPAEDDPLATCLSDDERSQIDRFDLAQLREVVRVCRSCASLAEAGRTLFQATRAQKKSQNDSDRLKKYLDRFGLTWARVRGE